jgi:hypothetical protein
MTAKKDDAEAAKGDVAEKVADEQAKGYVGDVPDPLPNSAYSLESGPDSPPHVPDDKTRVGLPVKEA